MARELDPPSAEALLVHAGWINRLAGALATDSHDAEDAVQDTWVAVLEGRLRHGGAPRSWLARVLTNALRSARRREHSRREHQGCPDIAARSDDPAEVLERAEMHQRLVATVLGLDEPNRTILLLRYFDELSAEEIARRRGVPSSTVRTQVLRGLALLRDHLDSEHGDDRRAWLASLGWQAFQQPSPLVLLKALVMANTVKVASAALVTGILVGWIWVTLAEQDTPREPGGPPAEERAVLSLAEVTDPPTYSDSHFPTSSSRQPAPSGNNRVGPSASGEVLVRVLWWDDTPAAEVRFEVVPRGRAMQRRHAVTDDQGTFLVGDLPAGPFELVSGHAGVNFLSLRDGEEAIKGVRPRFDVVAGTRAEVSVVMPRGARIGGRVLDLVGEPVPGASLWGVVGSGLMQEPLGRLGRTDASGNFLLRSIHPNYRIFASAAGRGCSPVTALPKIRTGDPGGLRKLELTLESPVGDVEIVARLPGGTPAVATRVRVRCSANANWHNGVREFVALTDADGRALFEGVPASRVELFADSPGLPLWQESLALAPEARRQVEIWFVEGFAVEGRVTNTTGQPVAGARVAEEQRRLPGPPFSSYFDAMEVETAADGSFRLSPLTPGEVTLRVDARGKAHDGPPAATVLKGTPGETLRWDPILDFELALHGRVILPQGIPLPNWVVEALPVRHEVSHMPKRALTDEAGRFEIGGVLRGLYDLRAYSPESHGNGPYQAELRRIRPSDGPVEFVILPEKRPTAHITGRVLAPNGTPLEGVWVLPIQEFVQPMRSMCETGVDGRFDLGPLRPGRFQLQFRHPEFGSALSEPVEVGQGGREDIGEVWPAHPGQLKVTVRRSDDVPVQGLDVFWLQGDGPLHKARAAEPGSLTAVLAPGRWLIWTFSANATAGQRVVIIRSGETALVDLVLDPGIRRHLRFIAPDKGELRPQITVHLRGPTPEQELVLMPYFDNSRQRVPAYHAFCTLSPGEYDYEVREESGLHASGSYEVERGANDYLSIDIELLD